MVEARGSDIARLLAIMARLRDPVNGCSWDIAQDFASIVPYTIEEAYEVADAIDRGDLPALKDELGDLLLQVVFHAQMASEQGAFAFAEVVAAISDKMERRHPHVFGDSGTTPGWHAIKRAERVAAGDTDVSALAGVARGLPEWQRAVKLQDRAARIGFDWPDHRAVLAKLEEEIAEVRVEFDAVEADPGDAAARLRLQDELGDLLFVAANLARHARVDVGAAMRGANAKFERRFRAMEEMARRDCADLAALAPEAQDRYWERVKDAEPR